MIHFTFRGEPFVFDQDRLSVEEAKQLKRVNGLTPRAFLTGLREYDPDAMDALVRLAKVRAGEQTRLEQVILGDWDLFADLDIEPPSENGEGPTVGATPPTSTTPPLTPSTPTGTGRTGSARSRSTSDTPPTR